MLHIISRVNGSAIIYVRNRDKTREIAKLLSDHGISAAYYHAGIDSRDKDKRQRQWTDGTIRVMVATNAFGMGIDKPDVRLVIHYEMPDSPEAYYQEAGRAGRDGLTAYAVMLYTPEDKRKLSRRVSDTYPEKEFIRKSERRTEYIMLSLRLATGLNLKRFRKRFDEDLLKTRASQIQALIKAGYIYIEDGFLKIAPQHMYVSNRIILELL